MSSGRILGKTFVFSILCVSLRAERCKSFVCDQLERCRSGRSGRSRKPLYLRVSRVRIPVSPQNGKEAQNLCESRGFFYADRWLGVYSQATYLHKKGNFPKGKLWASLVVCKGLAASERDHVAQRRNPKHPSPRP